MRAISSSHTIIFILFFYSEIFTVPAPSINHFPLTFTTFTGSSISVFSSFRVTIPVFLSYDFTAKTEFSSK